MTAIVGLVEKGRVWMGGDSAGVAGYSLRVRTDEKVFATGAFVFGFTTSFRMGQLLRYAFQPPAHDDRVPVEKYMATTFIDGVRECLKKGGFAKAEGGREEGGTFLVGFGGRLFEICDDYQVAQASGDFAAAGCGREVALGALYASRGRPGRERVVLALEAAECFSAGVRRPFRVVSCDRLRVARRRA